eukprot:CAMPEP_0181485188 /NCGR_PEP_ID=MMETSP1110-20121109/46425_1 /TAXON_ID=174948 /ORGANISM="Symbiodinium sp., Strain CCMP421" /LENGTH=78 /DNA_ID=CAMNT_0023611157 /DNA_START=297 /DNA_END=530 /DNA_ORIENTATION=-
MKPKLESLWAQVTGLQALRRSLGRSLRDWDDPRRQTQGSSSRPIVVTRFHSGRRTPSEVACAGTARGCGVTGTFLVSE